jgi:hypothetical protein
VHCHAFGPPCVLGAAAAVGVCEYVTSVVVADDAVCRWSVAPVYVSIRQHTSAYVSIRQHTSADDAVCRWSVALVYASVVKPVVDYSPMMLSAAGQ